MKNNNNIEDIMLTMKDLSEYFPKYHYYLMLAMYQEVTSRLQQLKNLDQHKTLTEHLKKAEDILQNIGKYLLAYPDLINEEKLHVTGSIKEISKQYQEFSKDTKSTLCIYGIAAQHPLYNNLRSVIVLIDIMVRELLDYQNKLNKTPIVSHVNNGK